MLSLLAALGRTESGRKQCFRPETFQSCLRKKEQLLESARLASNLNGGADSPEKKHCRLQGSLLFPRNPGRGSHGPQPRFINGMFWKVQVPISCELDAAMAWLPPCDDATLLYLNPLFASVLPRNSDFLIITDFPCRPRTRERLGWSWAHESPSNWACYVTWFLK